MNYIAAYGTLRSGGFFFRPSRQKVLGLHRLEGYDMYGANYCFPMVCKGKGTITVELQEVSDQEMQGIRLMESAYDEETIELDGKQVSLFVRDYERRFDGKIKSGDWIQHRKDICQDQF